jgi:hypothetical protein
VINIVVTTIVVAPALWLAGRMLVGHEKAKLSDAVLTIVVGTVIRALITSFFPGTIALIIQLLVWLGLIKHFFDTSWMRALNISILAILLFIIVSAILGLLGFAFFAVLF